MYPAGWAGGLQGTEAKVIALSMFMGQSPTLLQGGVNYKTFVPSIQCFCLFTHEQELKFQRLNCIIINADLKCLCASACTCAAVNFL